MKLRFAIMGMGLNWDYDFIRLIIHMKLRFKGWYLKLFNFIENKVYWVDFVMIIYGGYIEIMIS